MKKNIRLLIFCTTILHQSIAPLKVTPLHQILKQDTDIQYQKLFDSVQFDLPRFSIVPSMPHQGIFKELFVLTIPHGIVKGQHGYILIDGGFIQELIWGDLDNLYNIYSHAQDIATESIVAIPGKVAVIAQLEAKNYCHLILEIIARLCLLEAHNIEYDWLYIPCEEKSLVQKILDLLEIDPEIIISPTDNNFILQAEELIIPSLVINTDQGYRHSGNFHHPYTTKIVQQKLLEKVLKRNINTTHFCKKIFISRSDTQRRIANEDEIFEIFRPLGFKKYLLSNLSIPEQIMLFHNADIVVGEHGAGMTNILFCKPGTKIIEIFQNVTPIDFWHCAHICNLDYTPINTILGEQANYYSNWHQDFQRFFKFPNQPIVPLDQIKEIAKTL